MSLSVGHELIVKSSSPESIAREAELRGLKALHLDDGFTFTLPASNATLEDAAEAELKYPLVALKLVAACTWLTEMAPYAIPERRQVRRAD